MFIVFVGPDSALSEQNQVCLTILARTDHIESILCLPDVGVDPFRPRILRSQLSEGRPPARVCSVHETDIEIGGSTFTRGGTVWAPSNSSSSVDSAVTGGARKIRGSDDPDSTLVPQSDQLERPLTLQNQTSPPAPDETVDKMQVDVGTDSRPPAIRRVMRHHDDSGFRFDPPPVVQVVDVPPAYTTC